ncbi:MAG: stringent starvation protein A [Gammaproteobacteria bacterium]|nr:glutathione S-transferase N-terminal domain-containing protein [Gammaproteobacteria bacterium]NNJ92405.1 stringent starvation protein A [Gammaproteobacteria bacterium]
MAVVANKRSVMTLYSDPSSIHCHRVRFVLAEKNVTVDIVDADPLDLPEDVVEMNPYGTLPTILDRDLTLYDSRIIMEYLDERFPHPPLLPVDPVNRAASRLYLHRVDTDWYSKVETILKGGKGAAAARKELRESLITTVPVFKAMDFFMSESFSVVDASIAPLLWRLPMLGIELSPAAAKDVDNYANRLFEREAFQQSLTEEEREMRP